jgi:hypothetical protein
LKLRKPATKQDAFSVTTMLVANAIPLYGVLALNWDGLVVIILYLIETAIIGVFHALRIFSFGTFLGFKGGRMPKASIFVMLFFLFHFFMFLFVQSTLFFGFIKTEIPGLKSGFHVIHNFGLFFHEPYLISIYAFIASQVAYTGREALLTKEYARLDAAEYMFLPYVRIFVQQFVVIFGAMLFLAFNSVTALVILFIVLKTGGELIGQSYGLTWFNANKNNS